MSHHRRLCAAACVLASCILGSTTFADNYPRQEGVDAQHYIFKIAINDATEEFTGETTAQILFTKAGIAEVTLDLASLANGARGPATAPAATTAAATEPAGGTAPARGGRGGRGGRGAAGGNQSPRGMTVSSVKGGADGKTDLKFTHENSKLVITLPAPSKAGEKLTFIIAYKGLPGPAMHIGDNKFGDRSYFSENWPDRARGWIACIDHPYDKATSEFIITAPSKYQVVANGLLIDEVKKEGGTTTTHWKQSVPIASWLNAIGVSTFAMHKGEPILGTIPLQTWVYPGDAGMTAGIEDSAKKSVEFYSEFVGPYPYEKLANVQAYGIGGGTEHSSAIFYGETSLRAGAGNNFSLVAHEIAHQWFGCSVTEKDWDDVWLSEGFATYFTLMATEKWQGHEAFITGFKRSRTTVFSTERGMPNQPVIHPNLQGTRGVLNQLVYQKGSCVLHMLRGLIGDEKFQVGIRSYYKKYRDTNASTDDLRAEMEAASGMKLDWFFNQWLKRPGHPLIEGTWTYDAAAKKVIVELAQTQAADAFRLPMEIAFGIDGDAPRKADKIDMIEKKQRFEIPSEKEPTAVTLDPNTWMLMEAKFDKK